MLASIPAQITGAYLLDILRNGWALGGIIGAVMGAIAWTINERGSSAIGSMLAGAVLGLFVGFFVVGTSVLSNFSSAEAIFMNADQATGSTVRAILGILWFVLLGTALGGAVVSVGRALLGALAGVFAGTVAGMIITLLRIEMGLNVVGPVATLLVGATCLILIIIMSVGRDK